MEDARFTHEQLVRRLRQLEIELAHTDERELKSALARDVTRLQKIAEHLDRALHEEDVVDELV
jgi:phage FluMu protein gp41